MNPGCLALARPSRQKSRVRSPSSESSRKLIWLSTLHELSKARQIDVPARDQHADLLATHVELTLEHRRRREAAGGLDDHFHARGEEFHRRNELGVAHGEDVVHEPAYHRKRVHAEVLGLGAVGYRLRRLDVHDLPSAE